jgi:hypothetical protein
MCQLKNAICLTTLLLLSAGASAQQDVINTIAGGGPNNVPATSANVPGPFAVATDNSGNYYFTTGSYGQYRVFKVNTSGTLTVFAGNGSYGYSGDGGPATQAELEYPLGVAADSSGNVYIADSYNCVIRKVDSSGTISTFAGTPHSCGYGGDGGPATSAYLYDPYGVAVDSSGNVYIADTNNCRIREVTVSNGEINTVAGNGALGYSGDGGPATSAEISYPSSLALDGSGNVYIADTYNDVVREFSVGGNIYTVAGNGALGYSGDGGPATSAELYYPYAIAVDSPGNIFIADTYNFRIREVTVSNGKINTVAGNGTYCQSGGAACGDGGLATSAELSYVYGVAADSSDDIFIADFYNVAIRKVTDSPANTNPVSGNINTVAGNGTLDFSGNGIPATNAALNFPASATYDSAGNIYIADVNNCIVREVNATTGIITTIAGTAGSCGYGGDGGAATSAMLSLPQKVAVYAGYVYIADMGNCVIREVNPSGVISTFAGTPGSCSYGGDGGSATSAYLYSPFGVGVDSSGDVYIADTMNCVTRVVNTSGDISTFAGTPGSCGYGGDGGAATSAELNLPVDVALDASGNLYIADFYNQRIRKVNTAGIITTLAGNGSTGYSGDGGPANETSLTYPFGVAVDAAGDVLIGDSYNNRIRWVDGQGIIYTVAGNGDNGFFGDGGLGTSAWLAAPGGVGVDPSGNIYIADTDNSRIREVNAVAGLNASTYSVTFGVQKVGTTSTPEPVTLTAIGPLDINSITVTGDFSVTGDCESGALVGSCVMHIVFKPTLATVRTGTVTISDNGYFSPSVVINLTGYGTDVTVAPASLTFAAQRDGTTSAAKTVKLTNKGPTGLVMGSVGTTGAFVVSSNGCTGTVASLASCTIGVDFAPTLPGAQAGTLVINDSDGSSPQVVSLEGTAIGVSLAPTALTFAARDAGTTSPARTATLHNYASAALSISSASIIGTNAADFAIVPASTCTGSLAATSICTYNITFTPSVTGAETATLSVVDADGTQTATLNGTGIGAALSPTTLTFAAQDGGTVSAAKSVTLTNYLSSSLSISAGIGGTYASDFAILPTSTCGSSLAGDSKCTYNITFTPSVNGAESATLSVSDADGTQTAALKGTGIGAALSPTTLTFATQTKGTTSAAKIVALTNYLSSSLSISSATIGGTNAADFAIVSASTCTSSLAGNSSCTYNITFTPSVTGAETATLSVVDADGTQTATLKGTGE